MEAPWDVFTWCSLHMRMMRLNTRNKSQKPLFMSLHYSTLLPHGTLRLFLGSNHQQIQRGCDAFRGPGLWPTTCWGSLDGFTLKAISPKREALQKNIYQQHKINRGWMVNVPVWGVWTSLSNICWRFLYYIPSSRVMFNWDKNTNPW